MNQQLFEKYKAIQINTYKVISDSWEKELKEWTNKFGDTEKSKADFIWSGFNQILMAYAKAAKTEVELYSKQKEIYISMWEFLNDENRDAIHIKRQINNCYLRIAKANDRNSPFKSEIHFVANHCCPECDKLDEKIMSIDEAIEQQLLPNSQCTRIGGCVCCYAEIACIGKNGRLMRK